MSDLAQVHMVPFDAFAFANSRKDDLCMRTLLSNQQILISPATSNPDTESATLTVRSGGVSVRGQVMTDGIAASDMQTFSVRLRKSGPALDSNAPTLPREPVRHRVRTSAQEATSDIPVEACDVFLVTPVDIASLPASSAAVFNLASGTTINGRALAVKNCLAATVDSNQNLVQVRVVGMDRATVLNTRTLSPGHDTTFYGYLDRWF